MPLRERKEVQEMLREVIFMQINQPESYPLFTGLVSTNLLETLKMMRGISQIIGTFSATYIMVIARLKSAAGR